MLRDHLERATAHVQVVVVVHVDSPISPPSSNNCSSSSIETAYAIELQVFFCSAPRSCVKRNYNMSADGLMF
jgi:hypothetical protein